MDILLSALTNALAAQSVQSVSNVPSDGGGGGIPSILTSLPPGTLLRGFVLNRDPKGNPILRTDSGDFLIQSELFLKIGSDVVVRVDATGKNFKASIISVDGQQPQTAEATPAHAGDEDVVVTSPAARERPQSPPPSSTTSAGVTAARATPQATNIVTATLVRAASTEALPPETFFSLSSAYSPASELPRLPPGSIVSLRITSIAPPGNSSVEDAVSGTTPNVAPTAGSTPALNTPLAAAPSAATGVSLPAGSNTPAPSISTATAQPATSEPATPQASASPSPISSPAASPQLYNAYTKQAAFATPLATPAAAPSTPTSPPAANSAPIALNGTVTNQPASADTFVETPVGLFKLSTPLALAPGSTLKLEMVVQNTNAQDVSPDVPASIATLAQSWPVFQQLLTTLEQDGTDPLLSILKNSLPQFSAPSSQEQATTQGGAQQFTSGMLSFLSALKSNDFRGWIGERAARALEQKGGAEMLKRAEGEFQTMRALYTDAPPQQWQALFLPLLMEGELKQMRIFTKRERKRQERGGKPESDTRFVVEMDFSQLGPLQLDGLVKKRDAKTQFDLIVRSHVGLDEESRRDIQRIFTLTGETTGYTGMLMFQEANLFPVQPMDDILKDSHSDVTA